MGHIKLKQVWETLLSNYTSDDDLIRCLWEEIEQSYSSSRYYHNLHHLQNMLAHLSPYRERILDWDIALFALYYHDIVYVAGNRDNEWKSALIAEKNLKLLKIENARVVLCKEMINATKEHRKNDCKDISFLLDADMAILGSGKEDYIKYSEEVRQEFVQFSDDVYFAGRKKVLQQFLAMDSIYHTVEFQQRFEKQARENILCELGKYEGAG